MSRQSQLPPRCPLQKKTIPREAYELMPLKLQRESDLQPLHHRSASQSSIFEEQPEWIDDLLNDSGLSTKHISLRRSASDPVTLSDGIDQFTNMNSLNGDEKKVVHSETGIDLELPCKYGPNSPRRRTNLTFPDSAIVCALSELASQNAGQNYDTDQHAAGVTCHNSIGDSSGSACELNGDIKAVKRHQGQRSRVRKLQYIAELEKTVVVLQTLESELAARVASVFQQRLALSMENGKLKRQVAELQQEKLFVDGQYLSLQKEFDRLKDGFTKTSQCEGRTFYQSSLGPETDILDANWAIDMGKLNLY